MDQETKRRIDIIKRLCIRHKINFIWINEIDFYSDFKSRTISIHIPVTDEFFLSTLYEISNFAIGVNKDGFEKKFDKKKYVISRAEKYKISEASISIYVEESIEEIKQFIESNNCLFICPKLAEVAFRLKSTNYIDSFKKFLTKKSSIFPKWKTILTSEVKSLLNISKKRNKETLKRIEYIEKICLDNNTTIEGWVDNHKGGIAHIYKKTILIPIPKNDEDFLVALHEISHCVRGRMKTKFDEEVHAEIDAIKWGRNYGLSKKSILLYKKSAKENIEEYRIKEKIDELKYKYVYSIMDNQIKLILEN
jgi:hypothetical protein